MAGEPVPGRCSTVGDGAQLHRLFAAWTGETLGDYLRRRRVEVAALRPLRRPSLGVLQAALAAGFGSGEAFARAFKLRFGVAPSVWRMSKSNSDQDAVFERLQNALSPPSQEDLNVRLTNRTPTDFLYLRRTGTFGDPLGYFWPETVMPRIVADGTREADWTVEIFNAALTRDGCRARSRVSMGTSTRYWTAPLSRVRPLCATCLPSGIASATHGRCRRRSGAPTSTCP